MKIPFSKLSPTKFEEFCFDLLNQMGLVNLDWRKGTNSEDASPADQGRDIVGKIVKKDIDKEVIVEDWFIECKHHARALPFSELQNALSWAAAERPHTLLIIASGSLSNPAKAGLATYIRNNNPSFRIKVWERTQLERICEKHRSLLAQYRIVKSFVRKSAELITAENELFDRLWYFRHQNLKFAVRNGTTSVDSQIWRDAKKNAKRVESQYGKRSVQIDSDFDLGMLNGKLSAIRWALGEDWDFLDT
mgnify:CR=1 FL=1